MTVRRSTTDGSAETAKYEAPKPETSTESEIQMPQTKKPLPHRMDTTGRGSVFLAFELRAFGLASDSGFRLLDFSLGVWPNRAR